MRTPIAAAIAALFSTTTVFAADTTLPELIVTGAANDSIPMVSDPQPTPKSSVAKGGIDLLGGPAQTSIYGPLNLMPSVNVENTDPYGITSGSINIRGKSSFHLTKNVEGVPLTGIVGGADLFDLENIEQIDLYRGGVTANQGLGLSNASGAIDQRLLAPKAGFGMLGKQAFGSSNFRRTFVRLDTGKLGEIGPSVFISGSTASADLWKGAGDESRSNFMLGVSQQLGERVNLDLDLVYNKLDNHSYRALTYAQAQDLQTNYKREYNRSLTGVAATDVNYYKFNRNESESYAALAKIDVKLAEGHHLFFKPYYSKNDDATFSASGANVQLWRKQNDNYGGVLEYQGRYGAGTDVSVGYWQQSMEAPPPPTDQTKYTVAANGSLKFAGWSTLAKIDRFTVSSPYVQVTETLGKTLLSGGIRYMDLGLPKMQWYKTAGLPNVGYDQVWGYNPILDANTSVAAKHFGEFLPNIGISQELTPLWSVSASYGRKFGRPDWGPQASNYISNEAAFVAKGITLQSLFDRTKPELSDQIDISARYKSSALMIVPTVFLAKNQNRQVQVVDPALGGTLSYYQGTSRTTQYGVELEAGYEIGKSWQIFGSGTLVSETYDQDTPTLSGGASLATKGKQIPNAPKAMLKGGFTYRYADFAMSPIVRYVGKRYGDSAENQPVDSYTVVDLNAGYNFGHDIRIELAVLNLFDHRYISTISPNDFSLNGATSYNVSAPRTVAMTLSAKF